MTLFLKSKHTVWVYLNGNPQLLFLPAIEEASSKTVAIKTTLNPENNNVCFMETCFCFLATQMLSELRCFFYKVNLIFCKKNFLCWYWFWKCPWRWIFNSDQFPLIHLANADSQDELWVTLINSVLKFFCQIVFDVFFAKWTFWSLLFNPWPYLIISLYRGCFLILHVFVAMIQTKKHA